MNESLMTLCRRQKVSPLEARNYENMKGVHPYPYKIGSDVDEHKVNACLVPCVQ